MNETIISQILVGAAGDGTGGLISGLLLAVGGRVASRFQPPAKEQALRLALEAGLLSAFETLPDETSPLSKYYVDCIADFLRQDVVHQELSLLLSPYESFNYARLEAEFVRVTQGHAPKQIPDLDFAKFVKTLGHSFYEAVKDDKDLREVIKIERLDSLVEYSARGAAASEATAKHTEQIQIGVARLVQLAEKQRGYIDVGQIVELLSRIVPASSPLPTMLRNTLEAINQYHTQLYEWKELHSHLNGIIVVLPQFSLQVQRCTDENALVQNRSTLVILWEPVLMKVMPMLEWAKQIRHIGLPFEIMPDESVKGEPWAVEIRNAASHVTNTLRTQLTADDQLRDAVDVLRQRVHTHMFLVDNELRRTAGELFNLSRIALGSVK